MLAPVALDMHEITVTPLFKWMEVENIPKSETAGHLVMELHEMVEIRIAGSRNYVPCVPAGSFWKREGNQVITYAERWPDQYQAFKEGNTQEAQGTPLEMLRSFGVTPEQLSQCRALRIYSIEALDALEGTNLKNLGMNGNALKAAARSFLADRNNGAAALDEVAALKARIAELESRSTIVPEVALTPSEIDAMIGPVERSDDDVKAEIASITGARPRGNPSRATLDQMLAELKAA
jgi:hypothetical protein